MYRRIKELREDNDYSQEYVSGLLSCSRSNYAMYESGDVKISIGQLVKLADIYNTSTDYLLNMTDKKLTETEANEFDKIVFINNVKKLREERKLSQSFLAYNVLHCTQSAYSQYETGKRMMDIDSIVALAEFYKVGSDFIIGRRGKN